MQPAESVEDNGGENEGKIVTRELEKNTLAKAKFTETYYRKCEDLLLKQTIEEENQIMVGANEIAHKELDRLTKENQIWFVKYQENLERVDELFNKRRNYLESYYQQLHEELQELNQEELLIEHKLLRLENERNSTGVEGIATTIERYRMSFSQAKLENFCGYLLIILIILIVFYIHCNYEDFT